MKMRGMDITSFSWSDLAEEYFPANGWSFGVQIYRRFIR